jgi:hypothetical protein
MSFDIKEDCNAEEEAQARDSGWVDGWVALYRK